MPTNIAGNTARTLYTQQVSYLRKAVSFDTTGVASGVSAGVIPSGAIITGVGVMINTAFNAGTTNVLKVGTSSDDDAYLAAGDVDETATGYTLYTGKGAKLSAATDVQVTFDETGTAATAGSADVVVFFVPDDDG